MKGFLICFLALISLSRAENIFCAEGVSKLNGDGNACNQPILNARTRYAYDIKTDRCQTFTPDCNNLNSNNFKSLMDCQEQCVQDSSNKQAAKSSYSDESPDAGGDMSCHQPKESGTCTAHFQRYYYNWRERQCETFVYGGCGGNKNNFETKGDCEDKCKRHNTTEAKSSKYIEYSNESPNPNGDKAICSQPKESGTCVAHITRYYFNSQTKKCEKFIYGGCGANLNNFETIEDCQKTCGR